MIEASSGCVGDITECLIAKARDCSVKARCSSAAQKGIADIWERIRKALVDLSNQTVRLSFGCCTASCQRLFGNVYS